MKTRSNLFSGLLPRITRWGEEYIKLPFQAGFQKNGVWVIICWSGREDQPGEKQGRLDGISLALLNFTSLLIDTNTRIDDLFICF